MTYAHGCQCPVINTLLVVFLNIFFYWRLLTIQAFQIRILRTTNQGARKKKTFIEALTLLNPSPPELFTNLMQVFLHVEIYVFLKQEKSEMDDFASVRKESFGSKGKIV